MHVAQAILGSWAFHPPSFPNNSLGSLPRSSPASQRSVLLQGSSEPVPAELQQPGQVRWLHVGQWVQKGGLEQIQHCSAFSF